jgi:DNA-binding phage protein
MDHEARIQAAISDLESQTRKNYTSTTRKWGIKRTTLVKRFRGEIGPNRDTISYVYKQLTDI